MRDSLGWALCLGLAPCAAGKEPGGADGGVPDAPPDAAPAPCEASWSDGIAMDAPSLTPDGARAASCALRGMRAAAEASRVVCSGESDHGVAQSWILHGLLVRY